MLVQANPRPQSRALGIGPGADRTLIPVTQEWWPISSRLTSLPSSWGFAWPIVWRLPSFTNWQNGHLDKLGPKAGADTAPHSGALTWLNRQHGWILAMPIFWSLSALRNSLLLGQQMLSSHTMSKCLHGRWARLQSLTVSKLKAY